jgi:putative Mn2+ efflux pump MntP
MPLLLILGLAVALAMDCFTVAMGLACGSGRLTGRQTLRLASSFGLFQFAMPVAGWLAGGAVVRVAARFDHWLAFGLLGFIGGRMIYESFAHGGEDRACRRDQTKGTRLLILSIATSIDALAVGLSLGVMASAIVIPAAVIGGVSFLITVAGTALGPVVGRTLGRRAELAGGLILIAIGTRILLEHLHG